jgi:hypothetical protein
MKNLVSPRQQEFLGLWTIKLLAASTLKLVSGGLI